MRLPLLLLFSVFFFTGCANLKADNPGETLIKDDNGVVYAKGYDLMWQHKKSKTFVSSDDVNNYVKNLKIGGYTDWRIPSKNEVQDLFFAYDFGTGNPKDLDMNMEGAVWVKMEDGTMQSGSWSTGQTCSINRTFLKEKKGRVRAVRP